MNDELLNAVNVVCGECIERTGMNCNKCPVRRTVDAESGKLHEVTCLFDKHVEVSVFLSDDEIKNVSADGGGIPDWVQNCADVKDSETQIGFSRLKIVE